MSFEMQTMGAFLEARESASELLIKEGKRHKSMAIEEALILQAASDLLLNSRRFYGLQVADLVQVYHTTVYRKLNAFEEQDGLLTSSIEDRRRLYLPTDLGGEVIGRFQAHY